MRKPALPIQPTETKTTLRCSSSTLEAIHRVQETVCEWMLTSPDPDHRREALRWGIDDTLRLVLATFCRDYRISLEEEVSA